MNRERLMAQLREDEGESREVYRDSFGNLTVGVGHLVTKYDTLCSGDSISTDRMEAFFFWDLNQAINSSKRVFANFDNLPEAAQEVIVNMMFNLGAPRFNRFRKFISAVKSRNWQVAANEMEQSLWWHQVGDRAKRLQRRILECLSSESS